MEGYLRKIATATMSEAFVPPSKRPAKLSSIKTVFSKITDVSKTASDEILRDNFAKFEFSSTKVGSVDVGDVDSSGRLSTSDVPECLRGLWPFIFYTRLLGMCPLIRKGSQLLVTKWNPFWLNSVLGICIQLTMFSYSLGELSFKEMDSSGWAMAINNAVYYGHIFGNTLFMIWRIKHVPQFLQECKKVELICRKYKTSVTNDGLVKTCVLLFSFFMSAQLLGNVMYYLSEGAKENVTSVEEFFQRWNVEVTGKRGSLYAGIFLCLGEFYCDLGWTLGDILLTLVSAILTRYFVRLNREIAARDHCSLEMIEEVRSDHRIITNLVKHCNDSFAPLFLLTYVANIVYLFSRLYTGVGDDLRDPAVSVKIESVYAFTFQISIKILLPSYLAARLHEKAHETLMLIHNWPSSIHSPDVNYRLLVIGRFVTQVVTDNNTGISGCGYFIITKGFVVTLISALITYEIIILQFQAASLAAG